MSATGCLVSTPFCRISSVLRNVGSGQIEPLRWKDFVRVNTEFQSFIADARGFLNGDVVWSLEEGYWRFDGNHRCFRAAQRKRKVKSSTAIGQAAISKVANGRFMVVHAGSSLGVTDAAMSGLKKRLFMQDRLCVGKPVYRAGWGKRQGVQKVIPRIYRSRIN